MPPRRAAAGGRGRASAGTAAQAPAPAAMPSGRPGAEDEAAALPREETMVKDLLKSMVCER